jgi:hypothetical protein
MCTDMINRIDRSHLTNTPITDNYSRHAAAPAPATLAARLSGLSAAVAATMAEPATTTLVASSSLDLDIPVMKASSSKPLLEAALLVLAVPAMIFAGA